MSETMKCAIYYGPKDIRIEDVPMPTCGENDILVKNLRAGICGTDVGIYNHGGEAYGVFPGSQVGHEMVSKVVKIGKNVTDVNIGDVVFINPMTGKRIGQFAANGFGAFAEYAVVEDAKINYNFYVLNPDINLDIAGIIEPVAVGTRGATHLDPTPTSNIVILGAGTIGLSAAAGLINRDINNVIVVDINEWRLAKAEELGAKTINTKNSELGATLIEMIGSVKNMFGQDVPDVDIWVDAAGSIGLLSEAISLSKIGAKYSMVAVYQGKVPVDFSFFISSEMRLEGSCGYIDETIREVIEHIQKNEKIGTIVTSKFKFENLNEAIITAMKAENDIKVIIDFEM